MQLDKDPVDRTKILNNQASPVRRHPGVSRTDISIVSKDDIAFASANINRRCVERIGLTAGPIRSHGHEPWPIGRFALLERRFRLRKSRRIEIGQVDRFVVAANDGLPAGDAEGGSIGRLRAASLARPRRAPLIESCFPPIRGRKIRDGGISPSWKNGCWAGVRSRNCQRCEDRPAFCTEGVARSRSSSTLGASPSSGKTARNPEMRPNRSIGRLRACGVLNI